MSTNDYSNTRTLFKINPEKCNETLRQALLSVDGISEVEIPLADLGTIIVTADMTPKQVGKYINKFADIKGKKPWTGFRKPKPKPSPPSSYASADDGPNNEDKTLNPPQPPYNYYSPSGYPDGYNPQYFTDKSPLVQYSYTDYPSQQPDLSSTNYSSDSYNYPYSQSQSQPNYYPYEPQYQPHSSNMEYYQPPYQGGYSTSGSYQYGSGYSGQAHGSNDMPYNNNNMGGGSTSDNNNNSESCVIM